MGYLIVIQAINLISHPLRIEYLNLPLHLYVKIAGKTGLHTSPTLLNFPGSASSKFFRIFAENHYALRNLFRSILILFLSTLAALPLRAGGGVVSRCRELLERGERDSSFVLLSGVVNRYYANPADRAGHREAVQAMEMLGKLYLHQYYDYGKSYEYLATAIGIAEDENLADLLPDLYQDMAGQWNLSFLTGDDVRDKTVEYMKKAWRAALAAGCPELLIDYVVNVCNIDIGVEKPDFTDELNAFKRMRFKSAHAELPYKLAYIDATFAINAHDYRRAAGLFHQLRGLPSGGLYPEKFLMSAMASEADAWDLAGEAEDARRVWREGMEKAREVGAIDWQMIFANRLAHAYERDGMNDSADVYRYPSLLLNQQMREGCHLPAMRERELQTQVERVNSEVRQLSLIRAQRERQMVWIGAVALLMLAGLLFATWRYRTIRNKNRELFQKHQELMDAYRLVKEPGGNETGGGQHQQAKYPNSPLSGDMSSELYNRVVRALETSEEVFQSGFNVERMAQIVGSRPRLVSQAVNEKSGRSFAQMLSQRRIREGAARLVDAQWANYTIEAVAQSVGLNSAANFSRIFKASTGMSPSEYRKQGSR